jgi:hypothetical protein
MLKELLGSFEISVGNFMRNGCHVGLVGANPTWLKTKLHTCLKSRILYSQSEPRENFDSDNSTLIKGVIKTS